MTDFEKRIAKGKELEKYLLNYLRDNKIDYFLTGYENLIASNNALESLHYIKDDKTSAFIRYYPDFLVVTRNKRGGKISCLIEVKNSTGIEYECYHSYMILKDKLNVRILLFLKNRKLCMVEELYFIEIPEYDRIADMKIPIKDGVWKTPRNMNREDYNTYITAYRDAGKYTSGCSFAFIDFNKTRFYDLSILRR